MIHNTRVSIIVAIDEKRGIGKNNQLMWHIPGELPRFKRITMGHPIIMGRKTFESIGRPLPGRYNIVITRNKQKAISNKENLEFVHSLEEALEQAKIHNTKYKIRDTDEDEIFIIGGGQIFEQALPLADKLFLTIVKGDFGADVFFPDYSMFTKKLSEEEHDDGGYSYTFLEVEK